MANAKHRTTQFVRLRPKTSREIDVRDQKKILAEKLQFAGAFLNKAFNGCPHVYNR